MAWIRERYSELMHYIAKLGRLTPIALVSLFLPMAGFVALTLVSYPLGNWMRSEPALGGAVFFFGVLILCGFAIVATNVIGVLGGFSFGFSLGLGLLIGGIVGAAAIAFFFNQRLSGRRLTDLTEANKRADAIHKALVNEGFWRTTLIITLIRLSIVMPFAFTNFFLAAAKVPFVSYLIGTALGMLPRAAATTFVGAGLSELVMDGVTNHWILVLGLAATVVVIIVISVLSKRALMRLTGEDISAS